MKIYYEPQVYLIHYPTIRGDELVRFLKDHDVPDWKSSATTDADAIPEIAGRLCYMSFEKPRPGGNSAYLDNIKKARHGSVTEHPSWGFIFAGISRTCTHELVRHRLASYSQLSQRYVDESVCEVVCPLDLRVEVQAARTFIEDRAVNPDTCTAASIDSYFEDGYSIYDAAIAGLEWMRNMLRANEDYRKQVEYLSKKVQREAYSLDSQHNKTFSLEDWLGLCTREQKTNFRKTARQAARSVLPNATETKIYTTMNARAFRHMIEMRASSHAEPEIRMLAFKVWQILVKEAPALFSDYKQTQLPDGTVELTTEHRKV